MKLSIGIISCNRLKYLKALITSLNCILKNKKDGDEIELIVVDNASKESGLVDYLNEEESKSVIQKLFLRNNRNWKNDEYIAKNLIIKEASHDIILFLQDDLCFIATYNYLMQAYNAFINCDALCMDICGVRNQTVFRKIDYSKSYIYNNFKYWGTKNNHFQTIGLFKKHVFKECGEYPVGVKFSSWKLKGKETIQQEDYYSYMVKDKYLKNKKCKNITILSHIPLIIPIWNDPRGAYAFVRDNKRYGHYKSPVDGYELYYQHLTDLEMDKIMSFRFPSGFTSVAKPLGWEYLKDAKGEQEKYDRQKIFTEGPINDI